MRTWSIGLYTQSALYILGGLNHFWHPDFYLKVMPDHYRDPATLVKLSGGAEILGGLGLLIPATRRFSAGGIALMLLVFLDVHQYMVRHPQRFPDIPEWALWARIPFQFLLIGWALAYTRRHESGRPLELP